MTKWKIMQTQKENVKAAILKAAKTEFFEKGFKGASMRSISSISSISTSNIYNYYKNKDELLKDVLNPLLNKFSSIEKNHNSPEFINLDIFISSEYKDKHIELYIDLICFYREELKLLLFHSYGSQYENFREDFSNTHVKTGREYLTMLKTKYPKININIPDFFLHTVNSWILGTIGELVYHNVCREELKQIFDNYFTFIIAGWKKLIEPKE